MAGSTQDLTVFKDQQVLVFDPNMNFIDVWRDAPLLAGFKETINAGTTPIQVELPRAFDNFDLVGSVGSRGTVGQGNIVQYWLFGPGLPSTGLLRYQGIIDRFDVQIKESGEETLVVTIVPFSSVLGDHGVTSAVTFGTFNQSSTYVDVLNMFSYWFTTTDSVTGHPYTYPLTYDAGNPSSSGVKAQYAFQAQNLLSIFQTVILMLPPNWFFRTNPGNTITVNASPTTPQHILNIGQNVTTPQYSQDWTQLKNVVYVTGATSSPTTPTNPNVTIPLVSATVKGSDIATFGERIIFKNDSRIIDEFTAQQYALGLLNAADRSQYRTKIRVPDYRGDFYPSVGYDIESLKVGDTIQLLDVTKAPSQSAAQAIWDVANWDQANWDQALQAALSPVVQITSIDYNFFYVDLELGGFQPNHDQSLSILMQRFNDFSMV